MKLGAGTALVQTCLALVCVAIILSYIVVQSYILVLDHEIANVEATARDFTLDDMANHLHIQARDLRDLKDILVKNEVWIFIVVTTLAVVGTGFLYGKNKVLLAFPVLTLGSTVGIAIYVLAHIHPYCMDVPTCNAPLGAEWLEHGAITVFVNGTDALGSTALLRHADCASVKAFQAFVQDGVCVAVPAFAYTVLIASCVGLVGIGIAFLEKNSDGKNEFSSKLFMINKLLF